MQNVCVWGWGGGGNLFSPRPEKYYFQMKQQILLDNAKSVVFFCIVQVKIYFYEILLKVALNTINRIKFGFM
jgi:hypothetical protein